MVRFDSGSQYSSRAPGGAETEPLNYRSSYSSSNNAKLMIYQELWILIATSGVRLWLDRRSGNYGCG